MVKLEQTSRDNFSNWRKARLYGCPLGSRSIWWNVLSAKPCQHRKTARRQIRLPRGRGREGKRKRERGQGQGSKFSNRGTEARNGCRQAPLGRLRVRTWKREKRGVRRVSFWYSTASHVVTSLWHISHDSALYHAASLLNVRTLAFLLLYDISFWPSRRLPVLIVLLLLCEIWSPKTRISWNCY